MTGVQTCALPISDFEAKKEMRKRGFTDTQISLITSFVQLDEPELIEARTEFGKLLNKFKEERADEQEKVKKLGGLYIIGTERHESYGITLMCGWCGKGSPSS